MTDHTAAPVVRSPGNAEEQAVCRQETSLDEVACNEKAKECKERAIYCQTLLPSCEPISTKAILLVGSKTSNGLAL